MSESKFASYSSLWKLAYELYSVKEEKECLELDPFLAAKFESAQDIYGASSYLRHGNPIFFPATKDKINKLIYDLILSNAECADFEFGRLHAWLDISTKDLMVARWLNNGGANTYKLYSGFEIVVDIFSSSVARRIEILEKLIKMYKTHQFGKPIDVMSKLFVLADIENIEKYCEVIAKGTPLIQSVFLKRGDLPEKYVLKGVKALSKLSSQKSFDNKIDFNILAKLGPSGRLKAMQQLLGLFDRYYQKMIYYKNVRPDDYYYNRYKSYYESFGKRSMPFKQVPTKEEMEKFLFPCSIKYNDKVSQLMEKYEELLKTIAEEKDKEKVNGECF